MRDRWVWLLKGLGDFSVASVRKLIDDKMLPEVSLKTCWSKAVPIKVNVLAWKVRIDGLPTRFNISRRENKLKSDDLNSSRLSVLKCLLDDRNSRSGSGVGVDTAYPSYWIRRIGASWSRDHVYIFQNILFPYILDKAYCLSWIRRIDLVSFVVSGEYRHGYAVSSLMDTAKQEDMQDTSSRYENDTDALDADIRDSYLTKSQGLRKLKGNKVDTKFAKPSILKKSVLQPLRNQSIVRQSNAFQSERPKFSKPRFASQVDVKNDLPKPVTPHYFPKVRESVIVKPHHVIASGSSRNSSKESYGSNDMAHNYYLVEAKKKKQDKNTNLKPRKMPSARTHHTPNAFTPKHRKNNQTSRNWHASKSSDETLKAVQKAYHSRNPSSFSDSKHFVCLTCQKCIFNANHDARVTKFLKEVNSSIKVQSSKTRDSNKPVEQKSHTQTPVWKIFIGHRISLNKSFVVYEKTSLRSCLSSGLGPQLLTLKTISSGLVPNLSSLTPYVPQTKKDWDILFQLMFDEYFSTPSSVASLVPTVVTSEPADANGTPSSTSIDQDVPLQVAQLDNDPFFGVLIPKPNFEESSSMDVIPTNVHSVNQPPEHLRK
nr:RNA-directed DNA polymerase, eukaryota [Tanacetum cinerariifolium]